MRVIILGIDGYLGWPLALRLKNAGHEVYGIDSEKRRQWVHSQYSKSVIPIPDLWERVEGGVLIKRVDLLHEPSTLLSFLRHVEPKAIVHLAEQPSAAYSMKSYKTAVETYQNNVIGTLGLLYAMREACPNSHLLKLGSMGEYGTPPCPIPEGHFPTNDSYWLDSARDDVGRLDGLPFPRRPGSFYHATKVHDSVNIEFACRTWRLRCTDVMQGVVYGTRTDDMLKNCPECSGRGAKPVPSELQQRKEADQGKRQWLTCEPCVCNGNGKTNELDPRLVTRFDIDECFGTVINRFCAQAVVGEPLTIYGEGGQTRGFLPLRDSIRCMEITLNNPPQPGEYRVFNQYEETYTINDLAEAVFQSIQDTDGRSVEIQHIPNPRKELEQHEYNPICEKLKALGYEPTNDLQGQLRDMITDLLPHRERIESLKHVFQPKIKWSK